MLAWSSQSVASSCRVLFETQMSEKQIEVRILELVGLRQKMMNEGGFAKSLFNDRFEKLSRVISKEEIRERMRGVNPSAKEQPLIVEQPITRQKSIDDFVLFAESYAKVHKVDAQGFNKDGYTLIQVAMLENNSEMVQHLLNYGLDINAKNRRGRTALELATDGAISESISNNGVTHSFSMEMIKNSTVYIKFFLANGANPNLPMGEYKNAIAYAAQYKNGKRLTDILDIYIEAGTKIDVIDQEGNTLFHKFARVSDPAAMTWLIQKNRDAINTVNAEGFTALDISVRKGAEGRTVAKILKDNGAKQARPIRNALVVLSRGLDQYITSSDVREKQKLKAYYQSINQPVTFQQRHTTTKKSFIQKILGKPGEEK